MTRHGKHIIHRLVLLIEVPNRRLAKAAQGEIKRCLENAILPEIEQLLDSVDTGEHVLADKIEIDLGGMTIEQLASKLPVAALGSFNDEVEKVISRADHAVLQLNADEMAFEAFTYFLAHGSLPWYVGAGTEWLTQELLWLEKIIGSARSLAVFQSQIFAPVAIQRLFAQFSNEFIKELVKARLNITETELLTYLALLENVLRGYLQAHPVRTGIVEITDRQSLKEQLLYAVLLGSGKTGIRSAQFARVVRGYLQSRADTEIPTADKLFLYGKKAIPLDKKLLPDEAALKVERGRELEINKEANDDKGLFVKQAGIVILHPFLEYFFKDFALVQERDFADEPARQLAVHLLHYMATGRVADFEFDLQVEKFLCGWPLEKPVERLVGIPQTMCDESDNLLRAVIKHWKVLKNATPDGLREGFLTRNGKLLSDGEMPRLIIEHSDIDVLLDTLAWGISVVKLPWMERPLYVDWQ